MAYNVFADRTSALQRPVHWALAALTLAALTACHPNDPAPPAATAANTTTAPSTTVATPVAYVPPTADALYQMVAPIALYPDKLVALVLAGAIHPDEVTSAYSWLAQNPQGAVDAVNQQPWDPSIKSLTTFPNALNLMQSNLPWTTALGQAYNNDPTDVLNAVQVMRLRAQQAGRLQTNTHQRVVRAPAAATYTPNAAAVAMYRSAAIVPPPAEYIAIEPAQAQTIYVPSYDPREVYGEPVAYYQGYTYHPPVVNTISPVAVGALAFGAGVVITAALDHHDWGWHAWGVHWGDAPAQARWHRGDAPLPPMARPAVTYQQSTYVSHVNNVSNVRRDTTVINNYAAAPQTGVAVVSPSAGTAPSPAMPPGHHGEAALAGAVVAGTALGAMALHHAPAPTPHIAAPIPTPSAPSPTGYQAPRAGMPPPAIRMAGMPPGSAAPDHIGGLRAPHTMAAAVAPAHAGTAHLQSQAMAPTPPIAPIAPIAPVPPLQRPPAHANLSPSLMSATGTGLRHPASTEPAPRVAPALQPQPRPTATPQRPVVQAAAHPVSPPQPVTRPAPPVERHAAANGPAPQHPHAPAPPAAHAEHKDKERR